MEAPGASTVLLNFLRRHHQETGMKGVYMTRAELAEATALQEDELARGIRELVNRGVVGVYSYTRHGVPYIHLRDVPPACTTTIPEGGGTCTVGNCTPRVRGVTSESTLFPRAHFLQAVAKVEDVFAHQELAFQADAATVEITFGQLRRKVDLRVSLNRPGLNYDEFRSVLGKALTLVEQKLGRRVALSEFRVVNLHVSVDFLRLRLDNVGAVTLEAFDFWFARLYNKGPVLRSEAVLSGGVVTLDQALSFMQRGYYEASMLRDIFAGINDLKEAISVAPLSRMPVRDWPIHAGAADLFRRLFRAGRRKFPEGVKKKGNPA